MREAASGFSSWLVDWTLKNNFNMATCDLILFDWFISVIMLPYVINSLFTDDLNYTGFQTDSNGHFVAIQWLLMPFSAI